MNSDFQHFTSLFIFLFMFSILLHGGATRVELIYIVVVCTVVTRITLPLFFPKRITGQRKAYLSKLGLIVSYVGLLCFKIIKSSVVMVKIVLTGKSRPTMIRIKTRLTHPLAKLILATSITLTPGTITVDMTHNYLYVHWLDAVTAHSVKAGDLIKGDFENLLMRIFE